jgi:hypothetical protein
MIEAVARLDVLSRQGAALEHVARRHFLEASAVLMILIAVAIIDWISSCLRFAIIGRAAVVL